MKNDLVYITCYGQRKQWRRKAAYDFFKEGARNSEGSEQDRYNNILMELEDGLTEIKDLRLD